MRYLLSSSFINELPGRLTYLFDIFHMFFLPEVESDGFVSLRPIGDENISILFIIGHNFHVCKYLHDHNNDIKEKNIVLVTCMSSYYKWTLPKGKRSYATNTMDSRNTLLYDGSPYGFSFEISESELNFYVSDETDFYKRVENNFYRIS